MHKKNLIIFLREQIAEHNLQINENSRIEDDLGITGDDGTELIKLFSETFKVDISQFVFPKYFHPEPGVFSPSGEVCPLTVKDLLNAIETGVLK